jgi:type IX secretion system PorP/SprF family membrane protein
MKQLLITLSLLFSTSIYFSQDPIFFNNQQNRLFVNPAYAGTVESFSAAMNYRNQWPQLSGSYQTFTTEINQYLGKGNGVSILFTYDNAAKTLFKNELNLGYGKTISFNENHHLSLGVQAGFFTKKLNWDNLTFGDQIDPRRGFVYQSNDIPRGGSVFGLDFNAGLLYYTKFFFLGTSVKHLTQPNESVLGGVARLPMLYSAQIGGKIILNDLTVLPSISAYQQGTFGPSIVYNLAYRYKGFQLDMGYWSGNGLTFGVGVNYDKFSLGYTFGMSNSSLLSSSISTHEVRGVFKAKTFKKVNEHFFDF